MAEFVKQLHFLKNGTEETAKAYSAAGEVGTEYITNTIDGLTAYVPIGETSNNKATMGTVTKDGATKSILLCATAVGVVKYETPGTHTFTVPDGITSVTIDVVGAGGGGGTSTYVHYSGN